MLPIETIANIGQYVCGKDYINLSLTNKTMKSDLLYYSGSPYPLTHYQRKAYKELYDNNQTIVDFVSFPRTGSTPVLINYLYAHLKTKDHRVMIVVDNRYHRYKWHQHLFPLFGSDLLSIAPYSKERKHPCSTYYKGKRILLLYAECFDMDVIEIQEYFSPTLLIIKSKNKFYDDNYEEFRQQKTIFSYLWKSDISLSFIQTLACLPFPSYPQRCIVTDLSYAISRVYREHKKFILVNPSRKFIQRLKKKEYRVFHKKEEYNQSEEGILVYFRNNAIPRLHGVVMMGSSDLDDIKYVLSSTTITTLYYFGENKKPYHYIPNIFFNEVNLRISALCHSDVHLKFVVKDIYNSIIKINEMTYQWNSKDLFQTRIKIKGDDNIFLPLLSMDKVPS